MCLLLSKFIPCPFLEYSVAHSLAPLPCTTQALWVTAICDCGKWEDKRAGDGRSFPCSLLALSSTMIAPPWIQMTAFCPSFLWASPSLVSFLIPVHSSGFCTFIKIPSFVQFGVKYSLLKSYLIHHTTLLLCIYNLCVFCVYMKYTQIVHNFLVYLFLNFWLSIFLCFPQLLTYNWKRLVYVLWCVCV